MVPVSKPVTISMPPDAIQPNTTVPFDGSPVLSYNWTVNMRCDANNCVTQRVSVSSRTSTKPPHSPAIAILKLAETRFETFYRTINFVLVHISTPSETYDIRLLSFYLVV